jgi:hypothetical protein
MSIGWTQFGLRDLFWATFVIALVIGWATDRYRLNQEFESFVRIRDQSYQRMIHVTNQLQRENAAFKNADNSTSP